MLALKDNLFHCLSLQKYCQTLCIPQDIVNNIVNIIIELSQMDKIKELIPLNLKISPLLLKIEYKLIREIEDSLKWIDFYKEWKPKYGFFKDMYFENQQYYLPYRITYEQNRSARIYYVLCNGTIDDLFVKHKLSEGYESSVGYNEGYITDFTDIYDGYGDYCYCNLERNLHFATQLYEFGKYAFEYGNISSEKFDNCKIQYDKMHKFIDFNVKKLGISNYLVTNEFKFVLVMITVLDKYKNYNRDIWSEQKYFVHYVSDDEYFLINLEDYIPETCQVVNNCEFYYVEYNFLDTWRDVCRDDALEYVIDNYDI